MKREITILLALFATGLCVPDVEEYLKQRQQLLDKELRLSLGWELELGVEEEVFNQLLVKEKQKEMADSFKTAFFPPSFSFLETWKDYDSSGVFNMIKSLPKGGILHIHDISMASIHWLIHNATYRDNLHFKEANGFLEFKFMSPGMDGWENVQILRAREGDEKIDRWLKRKLMMGVEMERYETINDLWDKFTFCLVAASGIITYKPVFEDYFEQSLTEFLEDGVQYVEVRSTLPPVYELDGTSLGQMDVARIYKKKSDQFAAANPDWCGAKLIYAPIRKVPEATVVDDLMTARQLKKDLPDFFAGFDLVAQEDLGKPLLNFLEPLLEASPYIKYFFHAGETDWDWSSTDLNLADAILLNTSRIGHGYAIDKHPELQKMAREKDIAIEINPISNQVLGLVSDIRNHPASTLVKTSFPVVVSSDDPPVWGALPLSHDFYAAFMAIGGSSADLRFIKQLVLNSFKYSGMSGPEKSVCTDKFMRKWRRSINSLIRTSVPYVGIL